MTIPPPLFDRALHRRRLDRAAGTFSSAGFLQRRVADDFAWRVSAVRRDFYLAVDLAARDGAFAAALGQGGAAAKIGTLVQSDLSAAMLARLGGVRLAADEERLPFAASSFDLVVSGLSLHFVNDLVGALVQIRRALRPQGLFLGALLGGGTLAELRAVLLEAETQESGGAGPRVSPVLDPDDAPGLLRRAGFAEPVVDTDRVIVRYPHLPALVSDLRAMGATNALSERPPAALGRASLAAAGELYAERFAGADGKLPATFEIINLTGWAPAEG